MLDLIFNITADIMVFVALAFAVAFVFSYGVAANWRKTKEGRAVMYVFIALLAVSLISFLAIWIGPDYWIRPFWRMVGWGTVVYAIVNINVRLWQNIHKGEDPITGVERNPKRPEIPRQEG